MDDDSINEARRARKAERARRKMEGLAKKPGKIKDKLAELVGATEPPARRTRRTRRTRREMMPPHRVR